MKFPEHGRRANTTGLSHVNNQRYLLGWMSNDPVGVQHSKQVENLTSERPPRTCPGFGAIIVYTERNAFNHRRHKVSIMKGALM